MANTIASPGATTPVTRGRCWVRGMSRSMSRSTTMLIVFAPPAASVPPMSVAITSHVPGHAFAATIIAGSS